MAEAMNGYKILLMNTEHGSDQISPAGKRQEALKKIVDDLEPSIIFVQECTGPFAKKLGRTYYKKLLRKKTGFIFNEKEFSYTDYTDDRELQRLIETLKRKQVISTNFEFLGRVLVARFTSKAGSKGVPRLDMIAMSWHGQSTTSHKLEFFLNLLRVVKEIRKINKFSGEGGRMLPVIVAGDFNIVIPDRTPEWLTENDIDLVYHRYSPSQRRKHKMIDYFFSTKDLVIKDCKFVDLSVFKLDDGTIARDLFDHDPIQGTLSPSLASSAPQHDATQGTPSLSLAASAPEQDLSQHFSSLSLASSVPSMARLTQGTPSPSLASSVPQHDLTQGTPSPSLASSVPQHDLTQGNPSPPLASSVPQHDLTQDTPSANAQFI